MKQSWRICGKCGKVDRSWENQEAFYVGTSTKMKCPDCGDEETGFAQLCRNCCPTGHGTHADEEWAANVKKLNGTKTEPTHMTEEQADYQLMKAWAMIVDAEEILKKIDTPSKRDLKNEVLLCIDDARIQLSNYSKALPVSDLKKRTSLEYVTDKDDVEAVKAILEYKANFFDSFFVYMRDCKLLEVWGVKGVLSDNARAIKLR